MWYRTILLSKYLKHFFPPIMSTFVCLQESQSFTSVLLVITAMVSLAVTLGEGQDPGHVLCTPIEPPLGQAARVTACPALLVHTVTAQVLNISYHTKKPKPTNWKEELEIYPKHLPIPFHTKWFFYPLLILLHPVPIMKCKINLNFLSLVGVNLHLEGQLKEKCLSRSY